MNNHLQDELALNETYKCVQCGYCLPACPTYHTMQKETHSPRGRINLVRMAAEGHISLENIMEPIELCLGCRACETACPSNVPYGTILETTKHVLTKKEKLQGKKISNWAKDLLINKTIPNKNALSVIGSSMYFYEKTMLKSFFHKSKLINILPEPLMKFDNIIPSIASSKEKRSRKEVYVPKGEIRFKVAFFKGCIMDTVFQEINTLSMKLLEAAGCKVSIIEKQTCCGALHSHSGEIEKATELAKINIEAFENGNFDFIVNSIGGCGAMLVEYDNLFKNDKQWEKRARDFSVKNKDISYVLSLCSLPFSNEINKTVTYQPSCHMSNVQKNVEPPITLLKSIPGINYITQKDANSCCGSAGIYNLVHYEESMKILDNKMKNTEATNAEIVVTTNPGCHLQMKLGVERINRSEDIKVVHLVELLAEACNITSK